MKIEDLFFSSPVKCYNGCYDSKSQRVFDNREKIFKEIQKFEPEVKATFHHDNQYGPGFVSIHVYGRTIADGSDYVGALLNACEVLGINYETIDNR